MATYNEYEDKQTLIDNPSIPDINKVKANDMNYIKYNLPHISNEVDNTYRVNLLHSKNLFNGNSTLGYVENNGTITANSGWTSSQSYVPVKPNTTYIINGNNMGGRLLYCQYDNSQTMIGSRTETTPNTPITTGNDTYYIRFSTNTGTATNMVVQEGSSIIIPSINVDGEEIYNANLMNYSTSEQRIGTWIDGKNLYRKVIDFGTLPNNTQANVNHNISNMGQMVNISGVAYTSSTRLPIPMVGNSGIASGLAISIAVFNSTMRITTNADATAYSAYVILEYTKNN